MSDKLPHSFYKWLDKILKTCFSGDIVITLIKGRLVKVKRVQVYMPDELN